MIETQIISSFKEKLIDFASLESKSEFIRIKDKQIDGTKFFYQLSIWIFLMRINCALRIEPFDEEDDHCKKKKWILFFKKYLLDKRVESSGRDLNSLFFPNMYDLLTNPCFFSKEDLLPIKSQLIQYIEYTKNKMVRKTENLKGIKIKH